MNATISITKKYKINLKELGIGLLTLLLGFAFGYSIVIFSSKYRVEDEMFINLLEFSALEYPENPEPLSTFYQRYGQRELNLIKKDDFHFDFIFSSPLPHVATVALKNIDLRLFVPTMPEWVKGDRNLQIITLTEREWNRQQVIFETQDPSLSILGGDGYEKNHLYSVELVRNSLKAGLWEILLYAKEEGKKVLLYQGWFTLPLGHYKTTFEKLNHISYWRHWFRLEYWVSPAEKKLNLNRLRKIFSEMAATSVDYSKERIFAYGEQERKLRCFTASNVMTWEDFPRFKDCVHFPMFIAPGTYQNKKLCKNEYEKISSLTQIQLRAIESPNSLKLLNEIELTFQDDTTQNTYSLILGGIDFDDIPSLPVESYPEAPLFPFGIATPPVFQKYALLAKAPPLVSPLFCVFLDKDHRWVDPHKVALEGVIVHKDATDSRLVHLYLVSYQRHTLVGHYGFYLNS